MYSTTSTKKKKKQSLCQLMEMSGTYFVAFQCGRWVKESLILNPQMSISHFQKVCGPGVWQTHDREGASTSTAVTAAPASQVWGSAPFQQQFVSVVRRNLHPRWADELTRSPADALQWTQRVVWLSCCRSELGNWKNRLMKLNHVLKF